MLYPALIAVAALLTLAPVGLLFRWLRWGKGLFAWQKIVACIIVAGVLVTVWHLIPLLFRSVEPLYYRKGGSWPPSAAAMTGTIAALQRFWATVDWAPAAPKLKRLILYFVMALAGPTFAILLFLLLGHKLIVESHVFWGGRLSGLDVLGLLTFVPLLFGLVCLDINQSSLHPFYRRCKFIVAIDGECDGGLSCGSLMQLIRYAMIDFGITLSVDVSRFHKAADGTAPFHFALGIIRYPQLNANSPAATGYLLYVKLSRTGNEPPHVAYYQSQHAEFPHESTADQFFDEDQFEAYRALGHHAADDLFSSELLGDNRVPASLSDWFGTIHASLQDPNKK